MQAADGPALELSDIMHPMSPSPAPQTVPLPPETELHLPDPQLQPSHGNGMFAPEQGGAVTIQVYDIQRMPSTPEPLDQAELENMRQRVQQLGLTAPSHIHPNATPLERELASMVLRLTSDPILQPSSSQLASQADTIATLTLQRNLLLQAKEDERSRWDVACQGWERSAEALIRKHLAAKEPVAKEYEAERTLVRLRDENAALRTKLSDSHSRLSALESELSRLRPLLMIQSNFLKDPEVLQHASLVHFNPPDDRYDSRKKVKKPSDRVKKEKDDTPAVVSQTSVAVEPSAEEDAMKVVMDTVPSANGHTSGEAGVRPQDLTIAPEDTQRAGPSRQRLHSAGDVFAPPSQTDMPPPALKSSSRHTDKHGKTKEKRARFKAPGPRTPLFTDARAECVLSAARKIGRVRAGIAAGLMRAREREERQAEVTKKAREEAQRASGLVLPPDWQSAWVPAEGEPGPSNYQTAATGPSSNASTSVAQARTAGGQQMPSNTHPSGPYQLSATPPQMRVAPGTVPAHPYAVPGFVYMQAVPSPPGGRAAPAQVPQGTPMMVPVWPMQSPGPATPPTGRQQASGAGRGRGTAQNQAQGRTPVRGGRAQGAPTTPLDSLLSAATAARTMMVDDDTTGEGGGGEGEETEKEEEESELPVVKRSSRRRSAASAAALDKPVPKRRRVGTSTSAGSLSSQGAMGRTRRQTRAALAQAKEEQDQTRPTPDRKGKGKRREALIPQPQGKGKGRAAANLTPAQSTQAQAPSPPPPAPIARVRSALDVLADQAAQEQERMPASRSGSRRPSAEPEKEPQSAGPGPSAMSKVPASETTMVEEPEEPGPEEEEGVSDADAGADVEADADVDADADAEGSVDSNVAAQEGKAAHEGTGTGRSGEPSRIGQTQTEATMQGSISAPTSASMLSTRIRQIEPITVGAPQPVATSGCTDASTDTSANRS
ncbi:hypothetical protein DAEQUDRAFT_737477 [Daedalea quercina L-15889]|uniref:Uncharacterized protein n=1 Tax=Daedalea quercina L-15889 TaxID=1314783 RepID=A0A165R3B3_9APHY|nr:hypothetical protein DAEQUDRAFT_737477 [Daedalea quercina L-15889]